MCCPTYKYSRCFAKLIGWYDDDDDVFIAMEYFPLGDLQVHMTANPPMCEDDVQNISYQILEGLNYMHQQGFAHRDVKPAVSPLAPCLCSQGTIGIELTPPARPVEHPHKVPTTEPPLAGQDQRLWNQQAHIP